MTDQQQGAVELRETFFKHVERLQVEIVGRLVEDEQVRGLREQTGEKQPVAFAAGQRSNPILRPACGERESP